MPAGEGNRTADAELLGQKIALALRLGVDACDRSVSAEILYDSIYNPDQFEAPEWRSAQYPDRQPTLAAPLDYFARPRPPRPAFVCSMRNAMTANAYTGLTAFPGAIQAMGKLARQGEVIVWTQGDPVEQLRKLAYVDLGDLRRTIVQERDKPCTPERLRKTIGAIARTDKLASPVLDELAKGHQDHQVFALEDRVVNLSRLATGLAERGIRVTPIWVQQGTRGHWVPEGADEPAMQAAYNAVDSIEDVPEAIAERREPDRPLLVITDYDDVIGDRELQLKIQDNSVREALEFEWDLPADLTRSQWAVHIILAHHLNRAGDIMGLV